MAQPEQAAPGPAGTAQAGLIVPRLGRLDGTIGGDPYLMGGIQLEVQVQPWRASPLPSRGAFVAARAGGEWGDFSSFEREGLELGYFYQLPAVLQLVHFGASLSATVDRWNVWYESAAPGQWQGDSLAVGVSVRPVVRLWRLELSVPFELGRGFGPGQWYRAYAIDVGVVLF